MFKAYYLLSDAQIFILTIIYLQFQVIRHTGYDTQES